LSTDQNAEIMESLILSFNAVMPIFLLMVIGFSIKQTKLISKTVFDGMNTLVFRLFLPTLLFYNVYTTDTIENFSIKFVAFVIISIIATFLIGYFVVLAISKSNSKRGVILQGFFRSNFAILGLPLINSICEGKTTSLPSLMVAIVIPLFNVLAVVCFELFKNEDHTIKLRHLLKGIITNPLIIGTALGLLAFLFKIQLPSLLEKTVVDISKIATPLSIIILGGSFTFSSIKGYLKEIVVTVLTKLLIVPTIMLSVAVALGIRGEALACVLIVAGAPIAVSSFSTAKEMGGDEELAAQVIVLSSVLCIFTLFIWIYLLSASHLF